MCCGRNGCLSGVLYRPGRYHVVVYTLSIAHRENQPVLCSDYTVGRVLFVGCPFLWLKRLLRCPRNLPDRVLLRFCLCCCGGVCSQVRS